MNGNMHEGDLQRDDVWLARMLIERDPTARVAISRLRPSSGYEASIENVGSKQSLRS